LPFATPTVIYNLIVIIQGNCKEWLLLLLNLHLRKRFVQDTGAF
jgi:hypothetical protein